MREQSVYVFPCASVVPIYDGAKFVLRVCGATIESHPPEGQCKKCGVAFRVERGGDQHATH